MVKLYQATNNSLRQ